MHALKIVLCLAFVLQLNWAEASTVTYNAQTARLGDENGNKAADASSVSGNSDGSQLMNALYRKSRQSRCVRCYDDRYSTDRTGYGGGYASRAVDERSNWYYPQYDRYDDRYRGADYDRYYRDSRDDRYSSRTYGGYDTRTAGYDRYDTRATGYDRYDERRPAYDRYDDRRTDYGESRGYVYEPRDRYASAGYGADYRDRYYDRYRQGSTAGSAGYDRDYYDRYYSRYDFRNYRPWDETYRGESGFDNSGRGYYFAGDGNDRGYGSTPQRGTQEGPSPCGVRVPNCPYDSTMPVRVSTGSIDSGSLSNRPGITNVYNREQTDSHDPNANKSNGWTYRNDNDNNNHNHNNNHNNNNNNNSNNDNSKSSQNTASNTRNRENEQQSSAYGNRPPPRPLSVSYLFERDSNAIADGSASTDNGNKNEQTAGALTTPNASGSGMLAADKKESHDSSRDANAGKM